MAMPRYRDRLPRVPPTRRGGALAIDFVLVWLLSSFAGSFWQVPIYLLLWLGVRVFWVFRNQGQSLGRWALDMKVVDARYGRVPSLLALTKREAIIGGCTLLLVVSLNSFIKPSGVPNGAILLAVVPLLGDMALAFGDVQKRQAFHDRIAGTIVVQTRRGYSLDLKLRRLVAQLRQRVRR
ncbi:RDD family protein [Trichothermofontia sp.]